MLLIWFSTGLIAQNPGRAKDSIEGSPMRATHVLGLEGLSKNVNGNLSPPTSKLVHVFLSGQGAFKPSVREEVKKLDLVA